MSSNLNITIEQGQTWNYDFLILLDPCDKVVDLSGREIRMDIKKTYGGEVVKELSTTTGEIILTNGVWKGEWSSETDYVVGDIIKYYVTTAEEYIYLICILDNTDEEPQIGCEVTPSIYWTPYRQILFNLSSEETEEIAARSYIYNLEIIDNSVDPRIETKLSKGNFIVEPEVTI